MWRVILGRAPGSAGGNFPKFEPVRLQGSFSQVISIILQTWHLKKSLDSRGVSWRTISPDYAYGGRGYGDSNGILREDTIEFLCEEFFY